MKQSFFWCFPWDLEDEGVDAALGRMAGEIGVNSVSVIAAYQGVTEFRGRKMPGSWTIERDAAVHFQPERRCYVNTRVRPVAGAWMKTRNPLRKISDAVEKLGLDLRLMASCCWSETLVARYPMAGCVDVFGDPTYGRLCPSNPDVREYVASLAEDLTTHYPAKTLELDELHFGSLPQRQKWGMQIGMAMSEANAAMLSWCFCPSCRQRAEAAGIDVTRVVETVLTRLGAALVIAPEQLHEFDAFVSSDVNLAAYHAMRVESVTSLVKMVRNRIGTRLVLHAGVPSSSAAFDVRALASECDGFILPWADVDGDEPARRPAVIAAGGIARVETAHFCYPPYMQDGAALVAQVHKAADAGCRGMGFFNYGSAPEPCIEWARQAIRYARRESSEP